MKVTRKEFARQWQKGVTIKDIAKALKMSENSCRVKASLMRKDGITLKKFQVGRRCFKTSQLKRRK